ncbi:stage III sporulation protein AA [Moorella sp. Hama-1]|uniref:stage III sporulation protein AA n=1 Tax=Moorella sp. Hama-1 TaxID=2138101 RepID=UPI000D6486B5|nr:stage III sporulation protein AA [Moorella sp. Hama-1]BCV21796.1 stage III sporulation protein AA [Moorella sp. Hama-1]
MASVRLVKGEHTFPDPGQAPARVTDPLASLKELLPPAITAALENLPGGVRASLEEIRLRRERPLQVRWSGSEGWVTAGGLLTPKPDLAYRVTAGDLGRTIEALTRSSLYALEEELRSGYITVSGGHRVGLVGEAVVSRGEVRTLKNFAGLNLRLARAVPGCARSLITCLLEGGRPLHTLLLSPPRCGKTTILRDIIRLFSSGVPELQFTGVNVGVVDERSEIAGCWLGVPQLDVGPRTDVLDRCPRAAGMLMLLRAMGPEVIATDEIGRPEELAALQDILNAGVTVLASVHAGSLEELKCRPGWGELLDQGFWQRLVLLGRTLGPGTIEAVFTGDNRVLRQGPWRGEGRL